MEALDNRRKISPKDSNEILTRVFVGPILWSDGPQALQILSCVDRMDKKVPGVRKSYDILSEIGAARCRNRDASSGRANSCRPGRRI